MACPVLPRLSDYVDYWAARYGDYEAAVLDDTRWTYSDLAVEVARVRAALLQAGVGPGDRVAVLGHPCPRFLAIYLAVVEIGAVFQGLNPKYTEPELDCVLGDGAPVVVIDVLQPASSREEAAASAVRSRGRVIDPFARPAPELPPPAPDAPEPTDVVDRSPAVLVHTSGTTG